MKDVNFSKCKFTGEMVSYMYGELASDDCSAFERHLVDCVVCTDEFAAISISRFEVYDWKKLEFDPLETPRFEIPSEIAADISWAEKVRAAFAHRWVVPTFSFAAVAIIAVVTAGLIWQRSDNVEIVSTSVGPAPLAAPTKEYAPTRSATGNIENAREPGGRVAPRDARSSLAKRITPPQTTRTVRVRRDEVKQTVASTEQRAVPTLNEYTDDEDTSLRLAELLEDIDSR